MFKNTNLSKIVDFILEVLDNRNVHKHAYQNFRLNKLMRLEVKYYLILTIIILAHSCAGSKKSQMITKPTKSQYAPEGYQASGMVRYLNQGSDSVITARREDAFKQMYTVCAGKYKVTAENDRNVGQTTYSIFTNSSQTTSNRYWDITFQCE